MGGHKIEYPEACRNHVGKEPGEGEMAAKMVAKVNVGGCSLPAAMAMREAGRPLRFRAA